MADPIFPQFLTSQDVEAAQENIEGAKIRNRIDAMKAREMYQQQQRRSAWNAAANDPRGIFNPVTQQFSPRPGQPQPPAQPQPAPQPNTAAAQGAPAPTPPPMSEDDKAAMRGQKKLAAVTQMVQPLMTQAKNDPSVRTRINKMSGILENDPDHKALMAKLGYDEMSYKMDEETGEGAYTLTKNWSAQELEGLAEKAPNGQTLLPLAQHPGKYKIQFNDAGAVVGINLIPTEKLGKKTREELIDLSLHGTDEERKQARENLAEDAKLKKESSAATAAEGIVGFTADAIQQQAERYLATGVLPPMGMGKAGTAARQAIINLSAKIAKNQGLDVGDQLSRQSSVKASQGELNKLQAQRGQVMAFAANAEKNLKLAGQLSEKVNRSGVPLLNRWINAGKRSVAGDVDIVRFDAALRTGINEFAKVTSSATGGSVTSDSARKEVEDMLNAAQTPQQVKGIIDLLVNNELPNRRTSYDEQINQIKSAISGKPAKAEPLKVGRFTVEVE